MTLRKVICEHCNGVWTTGRMSPIIICPHCMNETRGNLNSYGIRFIEGIPFYIKK